MKLGCSSWSYHRTIERGILNQESWIRICGEELRLDGVELLAGHFPSTEKEYLRKVKILCTNLGLSIYCVSPGGNFTLPTEEEREKELQEVKRWIDIASYMGAPVVRIFAGGRVREGDKSRVWAPMIDCLKSLAHYAAQYGIVLGMENHGGGFTATSEGVIKILQEVNSPYLKLTLDTGNYLDSYPSIEATAPYAVLVHAKLYDVKGGEERELDYPRILRILRGVSYNGYLSIEYEGEDPEEISSVEKGITYLRKLLKRQRGIKQ